MLLTAGPGFFDDPEARQLLDEVERLAGSIYRAFTTTNGGPLNPEIRDRLKTEMAQVEAAAQPLVGRIPVEEWALSDQSEQVENNAPRGAGEL
jgi:hypothetical protein